MSLSGFRQRYPRWARFLGLRPALDPAYFYRRARRLRGLAALGVLVAFVTWAMPLLFTAVALTGKPMQPQAAGFQFMGHRALDVAQAPYGLLQLALAGLPELVAMLWLLFGVRRLATALMHTNRQWKAIASGFRSIGRALTLAAVLAILPVSVGTQSVPSASTVMVWNIGVAFGSRAILTVIATTVMALVARLLAQAAELADENRGFV